MLSGQKVCAHQGLPVPGVQHDTDAIQLVQIVFQRHREAALLRVNPHDVERNKIATHGRTSRDGHVVFVAVLGFHQVHQLLRCTSM